MDTDWSGHKMRPAAMNLLEYENSMDNMVVANWSFSGWRYKFENQWNNWISFWSQTSLTPRCCVGWKICALAILTFIFVPSLLFARSPGDSKNRTHQLLTWRIVNPVSCASCFFCSSEGYGCCKESKTKRKCHSQYMCGARWSLHCCSVATSSNLFQILFLIRCSLVAFFLWLCPPFVCSSWNSSQQSRCDAFDWWRRFSDGEDGTRRIAVVPGSAIQC